MFDVSQRGGIAVLQMSYGKANAIDLEFCQGIEKQLEEIRKSSAKALVLTGEGNIFSAGLDLVRVLEEGSEYRQALVPALSTAFEKLFFFQPDSCYMPILGFNNQAEVPRSRGSNRSGAYSDNMTKLITSFCHWVKFTTEIRE